MRTITDLHEFHNQSSRPIVLALGNFDGFHLGHQKLLRYVKAQAKKYRALAAVLTFRQHPHHILHPQQRPLLITGLEQKLFYLARAGMDLCFLQSFTPAFSQMSPHEFVEKILIKKLRVREVCMGYDAHFGHGRKGDTRMMKVFAEEYGFLFKRMGPVMSGKQPISSSLVRALLLKGKMEKVRECLGRPFSLFGKVVPGKGHGTHLGFPTANLEVHSDIMIPRGVYVASARFLSLGPRNNLEQTRGTWLVVRGASKWLPGVVNFGKRPTYPAFETPQPVLELFLLHFHKQVYGKMMEVAFHEFLRPERRFAAEEALKKQILLDVTTAQKRHPRANFKKAFTNDRG